MVARRLVGRPSASVSMIEAGGKTFGVEEMAAYDPRPPVRGIEGLLVVDASAIPILPSCSAHAPATMPAERAADFLTGVAARVSGGAQGMHAS
jgi:choline dehydrogenase-like flavoprotein